MRRPFQRLQGEPEDIDTDLVDGIELLEHNDSPSQGGSSHSPTLDRAGPASARPGQPRRSLHQVDIDIEWPIVDIPQQLMREPDSDNQSNAQANAIRVSVQGSTVFFRRNGCSLTSSDRVLGSCIPFSSLEPLQA